MANKDNLDAILTPKALSRRPPFFLATAPAGARQREQTASPRVREEANHVLRADVMSARARDPVIDRCGQNPPVRDGAMQNK